MTALPTSRMPVASIVIPTSNNEPVLAACLEALATSIDPARVPFEVLVIFQQMEERAVRAFCERFPGVRSLAVGINLGFGAANNYAVRRTGGEFVVLLNDDTRPQPGWLEALVDCARSDASIGAVGSQLVYMDGTVQEAGSVMWSDGTTACPGRGEPVDSPGFATVRDVDYSSANGLLVRRASFDAAGGFDDRYFPGYYEDADLCFTLRHVLGQRVVYQPRSVIFHVESATMNRDPEFRAFLFRRHRAAFCAKWAGVLEARYQPPPAPEANAAPSLETFVTQLELRAVAAYDEMRRAQDAADARNGSRAVTPAPSHATWSPAHPVARPGVPAAYEAYVETLERRIAERGAASAYALNEKTGAE